jgi:signal transduction histidine kinase
LRLDFIKLNTRLSLGFGLLGVIFLIYGLIFFRNQKIQDENLSIYSIASAQKLRYAELEQEVLQAQFLAKDYVNSGSPVTQRRFHEHINQIEILLADCLASESLNTSKDVLNSISSRLENYLNNFNTVVKNRRISDDLLDKQMPSRTISLEKALGSLKDQLTASMMINSLEKAENRVLTYSLTYKGVEMTKALGQIDHFEALALKMELDKSLIQDIKALRSFLIKISESTKAYLYFINVLMAADASELVHQSRVLDDHADKNLILMTQHIASVRDQTLATTFILCALLFLVGLALALGLGFSITRPLDRIRRTLNQLADGVSVVEVPGTDYRDEIGDLARAANIFKEQNQKTEKLLKESNALAQNLAIKEKELEESNQELEQFVFTVSHDLKSPLVTAMGYIGIVRELMAQNKGDAALSKLDRVVRSNERMSQLINDLLELSRVGRVELEMEDIDMEELVTEATLPMIQNSEKGRLELVAHRPFPGIKGNRSRILQVFENILGNAVKYGASSDGIVRINIYSEQRDKETVFCIQDKGPGIDHEFHEKVFGLFSRLENNSQGTGIGLAIVRKVMDHHQGGVWIETPSEQGARFCLSFTSPSIIS